MIANVEGRLSAIEKRAIVVQVGGIGLRIIVPGSFSARCGPVGSIVSLHTHLHLREDEIALYGCGTEDELQLFEQLLTVSGVGPRLAMALLTTLSADEIRNAIVTEQSSLLSRVPGVGAKIAKKLIFDLKDKIQFAGLATPPMQQQHIERDSEVMAALTTLGYSIVEAQLALQHVPAEIEDVEERLRAALAYLGM